MRKMNQIKAGMILSYMLIIVNALYGFVMTPYIVGCLGEMEYGVYKTIGSLANSLLILDIGLGSTVMRYVAKYVSNKEEEKIPQFLGMSIIQALLLCLVIAVVSAGVFQTIRPTYSATFTNEQVKKAQLLFAIYCINLLLHVWSGLLTGIIKGHNQFIYANSMQLLHLILRASVAFLLLQIHPDSLVLVLSDTCLSLLFMGMYAAYIKNSTKVSFAFSKFNISLFFESGKYTLVSFLVSLAYQIGGNLDNVVIGAISGPAMVTVYSMALLIYNMFQNLSMAVSNMLLPTVSKVLADDDESNSKTIRLIERVGRLQFVILGAALVGFFCIGKDFLTVWLGKGYEDVYLITLILIIPSLFELCVNSCLAILRAKNQLGFFAGTMCAAAVLNAVVTIFSVKYWSYIGAAVGTSLSVIIGNLIIMNVYFSRKLKLPMLEIYVKIFSRIWLCLALAGGTLAVVSRFLYGSVVALLANIAIFCVVYSISLWYWGLDSAEKREIPVLNRFVK